MKLFSVKRFLCCGAVLVMVSGAAFAVSGLQTPLKAELSKVLIDQAWQKTLNGEDAVKPWPWMDSTPIAELYIPKFEQKHVVMSGVSGATMAFAPGWHEGTAKPGEAGISLISAHRDTHFANLRRLEAGDYFSIVTADGTQKIYEVENVRIMEDPSIQVSHRGQDSVVILSTCYPFSNWQVGGDMRFVVIGREIQPHDLTVVSL